MTQDLQNPQNTTGQTIVINQMENKSNGAGVAGFVLALYFHGFRFLTGYCGF